MNEEIKKIVELEIDLDDLQLEEMGVQVVSFVEEPAIEVDFMAFSKQEFVEPKGDESESDFIGRCIPVLIGEGYDQEQATAICYTYYEGSYDPSQLSPYIDYDDDGNEVTRQRNQRIEVITTGSEEVTKGRINLDIITGSDYVYAYEELKLHLIGVHGSNNINDLI